MKILLIEDDSKIATYLAQGLREAGHAPDIAETGKDGLFLGSSNAYDVLVVDHSCLKLMALELSAPCVQRIFARLCFSSQRLAG